MEFCSVYTTAGILSDKTAVGIIFVDTKCVSDLTDL